jgi:hypothetical protein
MKAAYTDYFSRFMKKLEENNLITKSLLEFAESSKKRMIVFYLLGKTTTTA